MKKTGNINEKNVNEQINNELQRLPFNFWQLYPLLCPLLYPILYPLAEQMN